MNIQILLSLATLTGALALIIGLRFYRLLRPRTLRVRIILPDGRSNSYLRRTTREGDLRIEKQSYEYDATAITYEGLLKIPTAEYLAGNRKPIARRKVGKASELSPDAAYDGITSHIMRELLNAFAEGVLTPIMILLITGIIVVIAGIGVYYGGHKDSALLTSRVEILIKALPTPTSVPTISTVTRELR